MTKAYYFFIKRFLDILVSLISIIVLLPILVIVYILVYIKLGSPVVFKQERPGLNEEIFTMYKFRTMLNLTDSFGVDLSDDQRLTRFGKFLRSTSLDELPGLYNVLKGDLSIIGPRPLLVKYLPLYSEEQKLRHTVRPGLTGLAQISGRNFLSWDDKFKLDVFYSNNVTFLLDLKIFFLTFIKVFKREGINSGSSSTMEEFLGNDK